MTTTSAVFLLVAAALGALPSAAALLALPVGAVPGLLLGKWLVTTATGEIGAVAAGIACGLVAALLADAVTSAA